MFRAAQTGDVLELSDDDGNSAVTIAPARGAIVTRFRVGERDLLFLDESTLADRTKNVRGGIPLLFPSPGRLTGDRFERAGRSGSMKQHGFARDVVWNVDSLSTSAAAQSTLVIESTDATRAMYPWDFRLAVTFALRGPCLRLDVTVDNTGAEAMPFAFGIHPYFLVHDKAGATIATKATQAFDNVTKKAVAFHGFDLTAKEVDLHLIDHGSTDSAVTWGDGARLAIRASPELGRWVVWTLAGKDFVCVEPWTAPADALNTGESLLELGPGARCALWIEMEYEGRRVA
jgi:galactose mutarotase-like enzyme